MKHLLVKQARALAFSLILLAVTSAGPAAAEVIRSFDADIKLRKDCTLDVTETIKMDFESASRHGILRWIPCRFRRRLGSYSVDLKVASVSDETGQPYKYTVSRLGDDINLRIGDPDRTVSGMHLYRISYTVRHAINFFDNEPEVYWNVTGNESPFATDWVSARFHPPAGVRLSDIQSTCFVGPPGSTRRGATSRKGDTIVFTARALKPAEGLTIVARLPAGSVVKPSPWQEFLWFWQDWWPLMAFPAGTCGLLFGVWWNTGRDQGGGKPVSVEWNPPKDITPAEAGTLVDESCDMTDIVSTVIDLAARGFLKIKEVGAGANFLFLSNKDYQFTKVAAPAEEEAKLLAHEKLFLSGLFRAGENVRLLSDLKYKFYRDLPAIRDSIYDRVVEKHYFLTRPDQVRSSFQCVGVTLMVVGLLFFVLSQTALAGGTFLSGLIIRLSARAMPARTGEGSKKLHELLSFQRYVRLTEKKRIEVLAKDDPAIFGRLLPFAMVLGVADKWAEAFHDLLSQPPDWYQPAGYGPGYVFSPGGFVHDLGGAMNTMGSTFGSGPPPTSSSSGAGGGFSGFGGGGFSGGGFGGGGTGSW